METKLHKFAYPKTCQAQQYPRQLIDTELPPVGTNCYRLERHKFMIEHIANIVSG
ncbi:hypothetical protein [Hoylesella timonensis]|uniref:hypothetical protein n=1 Tax=Hoylesella timonensis TaxID=386414 RepID=UPI001FD52387|nr:hypothetical protein [Hoylesella timonensis]